MRKRLCKFNGVAVMRKTVGIGGRASQSRGRIGSMVVCERELEARSLVDGQRKRTRPVGAGRHRASEIGMGVSCRGSGEPGWRTKLELGRGKSLEQPGIGEQYPDTCKSREAARRASEQGNGNRRVENSEESWNELSRDHLGYPRSPGQDCEHDPGN